VLDNLKSGVKKADRYEPLLNRNYEDLMTHLGAVGIPTRPRKPRDKAKAENAVLQTERWVLAPLRDRILIGLEAARTAVWEQLDIVNARPFQKMDGSRESLYEELDRPALGPLPGKPWVVADWKTAKVNIDYHIDIDRYYFSVPYRYIGEELDVKVTRDLVEIFRKGQPVASHLRTRGRYSTKPEHMPSSHREHLDWNPPRVVRRAKRIGPSVAELIDRLLSSKRHPEQGYRPSLGIVRLADRWGEDRLEAACQRALVHSACSYHSVKTILEKGLDRIEESQPQAPLIGDHPNVRGGNTYSEGGRSC
jgi:transposase